MAMGQNNLLKLVGKSTLMNLPVKVHDGMTLTNNEMEILDWWCLGLATKQISVQLQKDIRWVQQKLHEASKRNSMPLTRLKYHYIAINAWRTLKIEVKL